MIPVGFLSMMKTTLHEIIHILYPDFVEMEVEEKATKWLNSFNWSVVKCSPFDEKTNDGGKISVLVNS